MYALTLLPTMVILDDKTFVYKDTPEWNVYQEWLAAGNTPTPLPEPSVNVPMTIALWQARAILIKLGLFDPVDAYITSRKTDIPELYEAWNYGNTVSRNGMFVTSLASNFGLTSADLDQLFIDGAKLVA